MIHLKVFNDGPALTDAIAALLRAHFSPPPESAGCRAVMLAGGTTPMAAYRKIVKAPIPVDPTLRVLFSDDRLVLPESPKSNYGNTLPLLRALNIPARRVLRVRGELPLEEAVAAYETGLRALLGGDCRLSLGLLGLGADGHTASLFSEAHIAAADQHLATGVNRPDGMQGVSVTPDLLSRADRIVFMVAGAGKQAALHKLLHEPLNIPAGLAVNSCRNVEVWADRTAVRPE